MSEPNGPGSEAGVAYGQIADPAEPEPAAEVHQESWFEPARYPTGQQPDSAELPGDPEAGPTGVGLPGDGSHRADEWFLRTGRAGLLPDSMTVSWDEAEHPAGRPDTAAAPPWAGERAEAELEEPPPWESGPWPEPGEARPEHRPWPSGAAAVPALRQPRPVDDTGNWQAVAALVTGVLPLVLPGLVFGVLGLRRSRSTGTGRALAWAGIALSLIWAVVVIGQLATGGGQPAQACGSSAQGAVQLSMQTVLRDLGGNAPESVVAADLGQAVSQANSAAAGAQQVSARNAMVALTGGLQEALRAVATDHSASSYAAIRTQLKADNAAEVSACKG
jgi:hypothetical protein